MPLQFVAQGPMLIPSGGAGTAAWNPANTNANVTLSNSNLTMLTNNATVGGGTRSVTTQSTGKWLVEFRLDAATVGNHFNGEVGVATSAQGLTGIDLGSGGGSIAHGGILLDAGNGRLNSTDLGPFGTVAVGDFVVMAVDLTNNKLWFKGSGASWSNLWNTAQTGTQVAANTGGINISTLTGPFYIWADAYGTNNGGAGTLGLTMNTNVGTFVNTDLPSGFIGWT